MRSLTDIESHVGSGLAAEGEIADSPEIDRSLGAVMREIARSLAGWLFFVVAVQLLLHGSHLIRI